MVKQVGLKEESEIFRFLKGIPEFRAKAADITARACLRQLRLLQKLVRLQRVTEIQRQ